MPKSSHYGLSGGSRLGSSIVNPTVHRADFSKSKCSTKIFVLIFALFFVDNVAAQAASNGVIWHPVDESSTSSTNTPISSTDFDRQQSAPSAVTTLQAMASQKKSQRQKATIPNDVLPPVTIVDSYKVGGPPTVKYVDNVIIPTSYEEPQNVVAMSTSKDEIQVDSKEEKAESRPEDEKDGLIFDDAYPRRVKTTLRHTQHHRLRQQEAWRQQQQQQQQQQQRRRQDSERRRRYYVSRPWRQQQYARPPFVPPSASASTKYYIPPVHPSPPRPHHNEDPIAEGSVKSVVFPEHAQVVRPPLTVVHPSTRYRQLVPTEADSRDEDEYDEYDEEEDSNRRHDLNWWLGGQPQTRRHQERGRSHTQNPSAGGNGGFFRSLMGVSPYCLHDDIQFNCVMTPVCWMAGGETLSGCDSMLYSCCVEPSIARKVRQLTFRLSCVSIISKVDLSQG